MKFRFYISFFFFRYKKASKVNEPRIKTLLYSHYNEEILTLKPTDNKNERRSSRKNKNGRNGAGMMIKHNSTDRTVCSPQKCK